MTRFGGPPPSAGKLGRSVEEYAAGAGIAVGRVRRWISFMVIGAALNRDTHRPTPLFAIKGGVALELRFRTRARATKDLDLILAHAEADPIEELDRALAEAHEGFTYRRKSGVRQLENGAIRFSLALDYRGSPWGTVPVDVSHTESDTTEMERLAGISLARFGLQGPEELPVLSLRYHIAQKIHAMTRPSTVDWRNDRERDLVDLLLLEELIHDYPGLREACLEVFEARSLHPWPPAGSLPSEWAAPVMALVREHGIAVRNYEEAMERVQGLIQRIQEARRK